MHSAHHHCLLPTTTTTIHAHHHHHQPRPPMLPPCATQAPMLLELGVQPAVSAATSQAAMLLSTVPASVIYAASGSLPTDYGICLAVIGLVATLAGQVVIAHIVKRTGRSSLLVFILTALFCMATCVGIVVVAIAVVRLVQNPAGLSATRASQLCGARHMHALNVAAAG